MVESVSSETPKEPVPAESADTTTSSSHDTTDLVVSSSHDTADLSTPDSANQSSKSKQFINTQSLNYGFLQMNH